jgi:encore-like protein
MSSYQRMLVHRVAAYFGMAHNIDPTGASVVVERTKYTRIPSTRFREWIQPDVPWTCPFPPQQQQQQQQQGSESAATGQTSTHQVANNGQSTLPRMRGKLGRGINSMEDGKMAHLSLDSEGGPHPAAVLPMRGSRGGMAKANSFGGYASEAGVALAPSGRHQPSLASSHNNGGPHQQQATARGPFSRGDSLSSTRSAYATRMMSKQDSVSSSTTSYLSAGTSSSGYRSCLGSSFETRTPSPVAHLGSMMYLSVNAQTQTCSLVRMFSLSQFLNGIKST